MKNSILTKEHTSVSLDAIREIHEKNKQLLSLV